MNLHLILTLLMSEVFSSEATMNFDFFKSSLGVVNCNFKTLRDEFVFKDNKSGQTISIFQDFSGNCITRDERVYFEKNNHIVPSNYFQNVNGKIEPLKSQEAIDLSNLLNSNKLYRISLDYYKLKKMHVIYLEFKAP